VTEFLLENVFLFDIDRPSDSGNTALHVAVNLEDVDLVRCVEVRMGV
jgi:ankyrin repeat protein